MRLEWARLPKSRHRRQLMFKNQTIWTGDNLPIMRGLGDDCVDLIYLDPPFNSNRNYAAPIGSEAAGAAFKDTWALDDVDIAWHDEIGAKSPALYSAIETAGQVYDKGMKSYLIMMAIRLIEMQRILKPTGSIYLHCDPTASHYLKMLMDAVFEAKNFRNEVIWAYRTGGASKRTFSKKHDVILFYSCSGTYTFNPQQEKTYTKAKGRKAGTVNYGGGTATFFEDDLGVYNLVKMRDVWEISYVGSTSPERTGYPTQKPLALLERIISASSNSGDLVLDPFCGCATALVAAEKLGRKWMGIDLSEVAVQLVKKRMVEETDLFTRFEPIHRTDIPKREGRRSKNIKTVLYGKQGGNCNLCKVHFLNVNLTVDHIVPRKHGGLDDDDNLQLLCQRCNSIKGTRTMQEAKARYNAQTR